MNISVRELVNLFVVYLCSFVCATVVYVSGFWVQFDQQLDVLFFKSAILLVIVGAILFVILVILSQQWSAMKFFTIRDALLATVTFMWLNHSLFGMVPFNASRSVSVMIVGYFYHNQGETLAEEDVEKYVRRLYFDNERAVRRRLEEQVAIGNLEKIGGNYRLTPKGVEVARMVGGITALFNMKKNYIADRYVFSD